MGQASGSHRGKRQEKPWGRLVEVLEQAHQGKACRMGRTTEGLRGRQTRDQWGRLLEVKVGGVINIMLGTSGAKLSGLTLHV